MKKIYSTIMMLVMIVTALSFATCSSGGDDDSGGDTPGGDGFIKVTFNGKTYTEGFPVYAQIKPSSYDSQNRSLTYTYDAVPHFEEKGFRFMYGIIHFTNKTDLLASSPGNYDCAGELFSSPDNNLTLTTQLSVDAEEYDWVSGTHQVTSIKKVNGGVQIEGSFTSTFKLDGNNQSVKGSYRMTIP